MHCPWTSYNIKFKTLDEKWKLFGSSDQNIAEFTKLYQETLEISLDFRLIVNPEAVELELTQNLLRTIGSVKVNVEMKEIMEDLEKLEKWSQPMPKCLLSGRLMQRGVKSLYSLELKLLQEDDEVIKGRIASLMELFKNTNSEDISQMILNALDTYKKLLIIEVELQNKLSCETIDSLINALLIILCHRKEFDHLNSMIKLLPYRRKIQILIDENRTVTDPNESGTKIRQCQLFVHTAIVQDLLQSEFLKPRKEQSQLTFNIITNLLIDLAQNESFVDRQLQRILLSANDMSVSSEFYYFAANMLRFKMPKRHEPLVVKLISIGISQDLSFLEQIKYTKENGELKWTEEDFVYCYQKMFMALLTLGFIVKDYAIRRLCIQAASVCEPRTTFCRTILDSLPDGASHVSDINEKMKETLSQLSEQLETFQSAIRMNVSLPSTWNKASLLCYENLDFFNRRIRLSDELQPLEYPGVEKHLKRLRLEETEEVENTEKKELDAQRILQESKEFLGGISSRLKLLKKLQTSDIVPTPSEITTRIIDALLKCESFDIKNGEIYMKISEEMSVCSKKNQYIDFFWLDRERSKENQKNLFFQFESEPESNTDVAAMYRSGCVPVYDLCLSSFPIFDIENIMLYTIMEKKRLFIKQEFIDMNRNKPVEHAKDQSHHAFNYILCRVFPEQGKLARTISVGLCMSGAFEYCLETYTFDAMPGRYKYTKKIQDTEEGDSPNVISDIFNTKLPKAMDRVRRPGPACKTRTPKVFKKLQSIPIPPTETFHASEELLGIFALIQNELSKAAGSKVTLDLTMLMNESSPHKLNLTYKCTSTTLNVKINKKRNGRICPSTSYEFDVPHRMHGSFNLAIELTDEIRYDENNDNPKIHTTGTAAIQANIWFDHVSLNVKNIDLECSLLEAKSTLKLGMRIGSRSRFKNEISKDSLGASKSLTECASDMHTAPTSDSSDIENNTHRTIKSEPVDFNSPEPSERILNSSNVSEHQTNEQPTEPLSNSMEESVEPHFHCDQPNESNETQQSQVFNIRPSVIQQTYPVQPNFNLEIKQEPMEIETQLTSTQELQHEASSIKDEPLSDEQLERMVSEIQQDHPEVTLEVLPRPEKFRIQKIENVTPREYIMVQPNGFDDSLLADLQVVPVNRHNGRTTVVQAVRINQRILAGGTVDDFEEMLSGDTHVVKNRTPQKASARMPFVKEQTPPKSPPPLRVFPEVFNRRLLLDPLNKSIKQEPIAVSADRLMSCTPPDDVIDLTKEAEEPYVIKRVKPCPRSKKDTRRRSFVYDYEPNFCESIFSSNDDQKKNIKESFTRVLKKVEAKNKGMTKRLVNSRSEDKTKTKKCKVHLRNVMEHIDLSIPRSNIVVNVKHVRLKLEPSLVPFRPKHRENVILQADVEPSFEDTSNFTTNINNPTFHLIYQNSVSYSTVESPGEGFTNVSLTANVGANCRADRPLNNANVNNKVLRKSLEPLYVDNIANAKILTKIDNVDLKKTIYSDKNCFNFTKNLKNCKKFSHQTPKLNNIDDKFKDEEDDKAKVSDKSLLYQASLDVMQSIPGMNSFEFFKFSSTPRRIIHVEVIHVYKNGNSSTSCDTSDTDGEQSSNIQSEKMNGEASHASSTHVQKIGLTSINREGDPKTVQTSFGSIIKNTYPPATLIARTGTEGPKAGEKFVKLKSDDVQIKKIIGQDLSALNKSNIKIVACTASSSQAEAQKPNRNQTLINMLTQQVMLPTNSNRHFIITSQKADVAKSDNNITTVTSSLPTHQNVVKKVVSPAQSQLVQILNSPPSNFTTKLINTTVASPQAKPANQIVTMTSPGNSQTFKAELPNAAKQQGIVQFICKTDGKIIHLTPICSNSAGGSSKKITYKVDTSGAKGPTILHHANQQIIINNQMKKSDNQNILTIIQKQDDGDKKKSPMLAVSQSPSAPSSPISTRSIYEETYAKFIQTSSSSKASDMGLLTISSSPINTPITSASTTSSIIQKIGKTVIQSSSPGLPKFNQAFGKTIFTTSQTNEPLKTKIISSKDFMTSRQMTVSFADTKPVTKLTRTVSEIKSTDAGTLLSLLEADNSDKQLPTLQSALQSNLLYARPIGNGKLLASSNNNVLLTALRSGNQSNNVRIITSISDSINRAGGTSMAPMRISVPIQIPKLINSSARPQTPGNYRQQIVIATTPTRMQQTTISSQQSGSKLESLLMTTQPTVVKKEVDVENHQSKIEVKQKKNVDHSTLEQLREFDMVLEQVLERSSSEVTATSISSPPTPESATSSPKKQLVIDGKIKAEMKLNSVTITSISPSVSPSPKPSSSCSAGKVAPKLQEDEHTAQRILDILANYKEQVRNSPDLNNKPAPRRRANPPTNPPAAKRKKIIVSSGSGSMKSSKQFGSTDMMTDTMGSEEDSSCGMGSGVASIGSINNSPQPQDIDDQTDVSMDNNFYMEDSKRETALSPQSSSSSVATSPSHNKFPISRRLILTETKTSSSSEASLSPTKNVVITNASGASLTSGTSIERFAGHGSAAVLMPGNYLLPMNVLKGGQQLAILSSNNGQKIIAVPANQLTSIGGANGTSIILQRYLNQANESKSRQQTDNSQSTFKPVRLQQNPTVSYVSKSNTADQSGNTFYIRPIQNMNQSINEGKTFISGQTTLIKQEDDSSKDSQNSKFVNDKTLITEIIQQQQQLSHTHQHPQQNFMIKLNEHQPSDPRSSSSIMFVSNSNTTSSSYVEAKIENPKVKLEEIDYDDYMKEDAIDLLNESAGMAKSPMLNTKIEEDDNTNSNHDTNNIYDDTIVKLENEHEQKFQQFPIILNHGKAMGMHQLSSSKNIKGFLIDPSNKIVMYSDRKPATIEKEFFNQKSFSEECADLGVDEPIASDLFPEADLLFDSGSPKFDQVGSHDGAMHIKKEIENGQVLLEMNYNHNMETESWLNFDTEEELVDDNQMNVKVDGAGNSGNYF